MALWNTASSSTLSYLIYTHGKFRKCIRSMFALSGHWTAAIILFNNGSTGKMLLMCENPKLNRCVILREQLKKRWSCLWFCTVSLSFDFHGAKCFYHDRSMIYHDPSRRSDVFIDNTNSVQLPHSFGKGSGVILAETQHRDSKAKVRVKRDTMLRKFSNLLIYLSF